MPNALTSYFLFLPPSPVRVEHWHHMLACAVFSSSLPRLYMRSLNTWRNGFLTWMAHTLVRGVALC